MAQAALFQSLIGRPVGPESDAIRTVLQLVGAGSRQPIEGDAAFELFLTKDDSFLIRVPRKGLAQFQKVVNAIQAVPSKPQK